jgi:tRNA threonylcarbamoyl adenosine modification protein YeaZ
LNVLAIDAALGPFAVALNLAGQVTSDRSDRNDALEGGLDRIARLLDAAGITLAGVDRIAVGIGPGSFTGIRIALSFAKALAYATGCPLVGISSYDVVTPASIARPHLTIVRGRRGVICARYVGADGAQDIACGATPEVLDRLLAGNPTGIGLRIVAATEDVFPELGETVPNAHRLLSPAGDNPAMVMAELARERVPSPSPHGIAPDYGEMPAVSGSKAGTRTAS